MRPRTMVNAAAVGSRFCARAVMNATKLRRQATTAPIDEARAALSNGQKRRSLAKNAVEAYERLLVALLRLRVPSLSSFFLFFLPKSTRLAVSSFEERARPTASPGCKRARSLESSGSCVLTKADARARGHRRRPCLRRLTSTLNTKVYSSLEKFLLLRLRWRSLLARCGLLIVSRVASACCCRKSCGSMCESGEIFSIVY